MSILDDLNNIKEAQDSDIKKEIYEAIIDDLRPYLQSLLNENCRLKDDLNALRDQFDGLYYKLEGIMATATPTVKMVEYKCYNL